MSHLEKGSTTLQEEAENMHQTSDSQNVAFEPAAVGAGNLPQRQILRPDLRTAESEALGAVPGCRSPLPCANH